MLITENEIINQTIRHNTIFKTVLDTPSTIVVPACQASHPLQPRCATHLGYTGLDNKYKEVRASVLVTDIAA